MGATAIVSPLSIEMADVAQANQIGQCISLGMSFQAELTERHDVVNVKFASQFLRRLPAVLTDLVPSKDGAASRSPRGAVIGQIAAAPRGTVLPASQSGKVSPLADFRAIPATLGMAWLHAEHRIADGANLHHAHGHAGPLESVGRMILTTDMGGLPVSVTAQRAKSASRVFGGRFKRLAALLADRRDLAVLKIGNLASDVRPARTGQRAVFPWPALEIAKHGSALRARRFRPLGSGVVSASLAAIGLLPALEVTELLPTGGAGRCYPVRRVRNSSASHKPDYTTFRPSPRRV